MLKRFYKENVIFKRSLYIKIYFCTFRLGENFLYFLREAVREFNIEICTLSVRHSAARRKLTNYSSPSDDGKACLVSGDTS